MNARAYRAVVVGCGRIGSTFTDDARIPGTHSHCQAYAEHPRTTLAAVCDADAARLDAAMRRWSVPGHGDAIALCREVRPDVVSVCTPDPTHAALIGSILEAAPPRLIFAEKPVAERAEDAAALTDLARRRGTVLMVDHTRRFSGAFRALADELRAGVHGRPVLARIVYGKGLRHNGVHAIDLLRLWLGEPTGVSGRATRWSSNGDRTFDATLDFAGGARAHLESFDEDVATIFEGELLAERTRWRFWSGGNEWEFGAIGEGPLYAGYRSYHPTGRERSDERFQQPIGRCLSEAVENVVAVLDGRAAPLGSAEDAIADMRIIEEIERTAAPA